MEIMPDALRGRMLSVGTMLSIGAVPLASLGSGLMLEATSVRTTILVLAAGMACVAVIATFSRAARNPPVVA